MAEETPPAEDKKDEAANPQNPDSDADALEPKDEVANADGSIDATSSNAAPVTKSDKPEPKKSLKEKLRKFNLYLLLFVFLLVIGVAIITVAYFQSKKAEDAGTIKTQELTQNALDQVAASDATVGNSQQVLNVQSSAVFAGKVLVRDGLEVAGNLHIGGTVALTNLTVNGTTQLGQVQVNKDLAVAGDIGIQGAVTIAKSLQVNGSGQFSGALTAPQITTSNFQLNGDLTLTHHFIAGGATPGRSVGAAVGSGGTASVSGSDTSGTVTINTGGSPPSGCFVTINFTSRYSNTPHVNITPVGSAAGGLAYYVNRTTSNFSICDATPPPASSSFAFDYFVVD